MVTGYLLWTIKGDRVWKEIGPRMGPYSAPDPVRHTHPTVKQLQWVLKRRIEFGSWEDMVRGELLEYNPWKAHWVEGHGLYFWANRDTGVSQWAQPPEARRESSAYSP